MTKNQDDAFEIYRRGIILAKGSVNLAKGGVSVVGPP